MPLRSRFLETQLRSLLSENGFLSAEDLAARIHVTREEVLPLLEALLIDRYIACCQVNERVTYRLNSTLEFELLRTLDEEEAPVPHSELPRSVKARALLALVQAGTVEVEAGASGEPPRYSSVPCTLLE